MSDKMSEIEVICMARRGLVVSNAFTIWEEFFHMVERLKNEFAKYDVELVHKRNDEILAFIDENGNARANIGDFDFIIYFDKDYHIARLLELAGYRLFNNAEAIRVCDSKMLTHLALTNHGIKMPKTINYPLRYGTGSDASFHERVIHELGFPMVIKHFYGSLGEQVYLVHNKEEFEGVTSKLQDIPHLYQEFIESSFGKDLRIVLIGQEIVASMQRNAQAPGEFRSNIETGGIGLQVEIPVSFAEMAIKVSKVLNLDYCGLDLLYGRDGEPLLMEVNASAYFGPIEKYSKKDVAGRYVKYVVDQVYPK